ncbi:MAG: hypothetical protein WCP31_10560, partial [Chloroflexales bacterium]
MNGLGLLEDSYSSSAGRRELEARLGSGRRELAGRLGSARRELEALLALESARREPEALPEAALLLAEEV